MAQCDQGYLCAVCGREVEGLVESDLYLRYVIGWLDPEVLHTSKERHITCNPVLGQFIVDPRFPPIAVTGDYDKRLLDEEFVRAREDLVTRGWQRLHELRGQEISVLEYPLPEVRAEMRQKYGGAEAV